MKEKFNLREEIRKVLNESGYSRVANIMRGLVPNVKTFSFLTASNPFGVEVDAKTNNSANKKLEEKLRSMNLGFTKVQGKYGVEEDSFFVPNITKDEALNLGKLFSQESILFGEKNDKDNYDGVVFQMIFTDDRFGEIVGERNVYINKNNDDDYYTSVKGRKFQIPFFDDEFSKAKFNSNSGVIDKNNIDEVEVKNLNKQIDKILEENRTSKSRWINRGSLNSALKKLT